MEGKRFGIEGITRLAIILVIIAGFAFGEKSSHIELYILSLLIFILNSQARVNFMKGRLFLLSLFADIGIVFYMNTSFSGLSYVLLYITIMDGLIFLALEGYIIAAIAAGFLAFFIRNESLDAILLNAVVFLVVSISSYQVRKFRDNMEKLEILFDENRKYSYQLEDAKKRLEDYAARVENASQLEERNRIAREIHDTVGHKLTGVLMQVDAAIRVSELDAGAGRQMFDSVRDNLSGCIDIMRQTVEGMRPKDYTNRILSIRQMIDDFSRSSGVGMEFNISGNPLKLYPGVEVTLYKNTQEAITNAVRHGAADHIWVELAYRENEVYLSVRDNGKGCSNVVKGMGFSGMEERVALLGGNVSVESTGQGFEVKTVIPIKGDIPQDPIRVHPC